MLSIRSPASTHSPLGSLTQLGQLALQLDNLCAERCHYVANHHSPSWLLGLRCWSKNIKPTYAYVFALGELGLPSSLCHLGAAVCLR